MKISVLILEDNPLTAQDLKELLENNNFKVCGISYDVCDAVRLMETSKPDVLLVDIKLKGERTGIDFVKSLDNKKPVIYLTANSDKHTVEEALATNPSSFITKPFNEQNVIISIELAFRNHAEKVLQNGMTDTIYLKSGNKFERVNIDSILYMEADGSYCKVITEKKDFILSGNLNAIASKFSVGNFVRIHRSYVVNIKSVTGLNNDYLFVGEKSLPISRGYRNDVKSLFRRFS